MPVSVIGIDIAKNVFQVHGVDDAGRLCCSGSYGASR